MRASRNNPAAAAFVRACVRACVSTRPATPPPHTRPGPAGPGSTDPGPTGIRAPAAARVDTRPRGQIRRLFTGGPRPGLGPDLTPVD